MDRNVNCLSISYKLEHIKEPKKPANEVGIAYSDWPQPEGATLPKAAKLAWIK